MSDLAALLGTMVLLAALIVINVYWYRRERVIREGLQKSVEWDQGDVGDNTKFERVVEETASILDATVDDVPEAVKSIDKKVRRLEGDIKEIRSTWGRMVGEALSVEPPDSDHLLFIELVDGSQDDAVALANALDRTGVTVICAHADSAFVVTSGTPERHSAVEIATSATEKVNGGAGGTDRFAQGGGEATVFDELRTVSANEIGATPTEISLGRNHGGLDAE